jgi:sarcosine oxidase subunit alpha
VTQPGRLERGGRIDRERPIQFRFNEKTVEAYVGDTVASALLANGVHLVGRSFKYHRPRGILSHGSEEPNALLSVNRGAGRTDPNNRATVIEATDGLVTSSQNHWPSLALDFGAVSDVLSPVFVAGFYYKTFMWPPSFWDRVYEPRIRATAGLGVAPSEPDRDRYVHRHAHCDVLVIGGGPAGLAAALAAANSGKRVILADEQQEFGGTLLHDLTSKIDGLDCWSWLEQSLAELRGRDNVTLLSRTTAFGYYNHNHVALVERVTDHLHEPSPDVPRERLWQVRAGEVVLATGAHERPLVFAENDRPGMVLAESVRAFVNRFGVAPGRRVVIATNGASAYQVAEDLHTAGIDVRLVDVRPEAACGPELAAAQSRGITVMTGHTVVGSKGRRRRGFGECSTGTFRAQRESGQHARPCCTRRGFSERRCAALRG